MENAQPTTETGITRQNGTGKADANLSREPTALASDREDREFRAAEPHQEMAQVLHCESRVHFLSGPSPTASEGEGAYSLKGTDRSYLPLRGKLDG